MDVAPKQKTTPRQKVAQLIRMLGGSGGERRNAFILLEQLMRSERVNWSDIGNWVEHGGEHDEGKYTEGEMREFAQAARAEGVDAGIHIGLARAGNGSGNGHLTLPEPATMAEYCHQQLGRLKTDWQREFIADIFIITRRASRLSPGRLANLAKIYIEFGGRI